MCWLNYKTMIRIYHFPHFTLTYALDSGQVRTFYVDDYYSKVNVNEDHAYHAGLLGLTAGQANLLHELAHHVVAIYAFEETTCPIVYYSAYQMPMPPDAQRREWLITAISYFSRQCNMRHQHEWSAIGELSTKCNVWRVADILSKLLDGIPIDNVKISYRK